MSHHCLFGFLVLLSCLLFQVSSRPSNNEETTTLSLEFLTKDIQPYFKDEENISLPSDQVTDTYDDNTKDILDKIKAINEALKKPHRRQQINWYNQPQTESYIMDKEILEKLQEIIASGKLHGIPDTLKHKDDNNHLNDIRYSRQVVMGPRNSGMPVMPMPYVMNLPVLVMPSTNNMYGRYPMNNDVNPLDFGSSYQTRQDAPSSPFQFQWPLASFFPLLIRDPLLSVLNGGGWNNFIEYGQSADVCNRKQKSVDEFNNEQNVSEYDASEINDNIALNSVSRYNSREGRAIKKRAVSQTSNFQETDNTKSAKKVYSTKPVTTRKPVKQDYTEEQNTKTTTNANEGDLRFPFGDFTWFGNKKPVAPSPGFFINRLKVHRGGVAIAGPGGVATAGKGGAAIVGPGGLAYTQPGGLAVAGPAARVVALSSDINLSSIVSRLQEQAETNGSVPNYLNAVPEGKVVATGPVIYYHPNHHS